VINLIVLYQAVNYLVKDMTPIVGTTEWKIKLILTCDLKALMKMLGLYDVFHPGAKWKCPFCPVSTK